MKIIESDAPALLAFLQEKKAAGDNWVAYPLLNTPVSVRSVRCFPSAFDAGRYCEEMGLKDIIQGEMSGKT